MNRWVRAAAALAACALLSGCAASRPEVKKKKEPPGVSVRLPVADAATLNMESLPALGQPELPLSMADETRGRWLTLFQLNYSPAKPPHPLLPAIDEEPPR